MLATFADRDDVLTLDSLGCTLALAELYAGLAFDRPRR